MWWNIPLIPGLRRQRQVESLCKAGLGVCVCVYTSKKDELHGCVCVCVCTSKKDELHGTQFSRYYTHIYKDAYFYFGNNSLYDWWLRDSILILSLPEVDNVRAGVLGHSSLHMNTYIFKKELHSKLMLGWEFRSIVFTLLYFKDACS